MKITNKTKWRTEDLRYIVGQALQAHGVPSQGLELHVITGRMWARGWADAPRLRSVDQTYVTDRYLDLNIPAPPRQAFDPASDEHTEFVVMLARLLDAVALMLKKGGKFRRDWQEKPIAWLSDWYEVNRGEKGKTAGCPISPLLAEAPPDKATLQREQLDHARAMLARAATRVKRATTIEKGWRRTVRRLERKAGDK